MFWDCPSIKLHIFVTCLFVWWTDFDETCLIYLSGGAERFSGSEVKGQGMNRPIDKVVCCSVFF